MLPTLGLFKQIPCPQPSCDRVSCFFSHDPAHQHVARKRKLESALGTPAHTTSLMTKKVAKAPPVSVKAMPTTTKVSTTKTTASSAKTQTKALPTLPSPSSTTKPKDQIPVPRSSISSRIPNAPAATTPTRATGKQPQRVAHTPTFAFSSSGPPTILPSVQSHAPLKLRQTMANKVHEHFERIYKPLQQPLLVREHTERQEAAILKQTSNLAGYKQMAANILTRLKKRPCARDAKDVGIDGEWIDPVTVQQQPSLSKGTETCLLTPEQFVIMEYPTAELLTSQASSTTNKDAVGLCKQCDRCKKEYEVKAVLSKEDLTPCLYHFGRRRTAKTNGEKERVYTCCGEPVGTNGCTYGPHVHKDNDMNELHAKIPYIKTPQVPSSLSTYRTLVALDCEMCYTTVGMELVRLTAVDEHLEVIIDELVLPSGMIIDLNTRFSGIKTLEGVRHNLDSVRQELFKYVDANTILLGHGLENDLNAMRIIHGRVIDTAALFPHPNGLPFRYSLRMLVSRHLSRFIQESADGHDSFEDAKSCVELLRVYMKKNKQPA